jgi:hypothetical protein
MTRDEPIRRNRTRAAHVGTARWHEVSAAIIAIVIGVSCSAARRNDQAGRDAGAPHDSSAGGHLECFPLGLYLFCDGDNVTAKDENCQPRFVLKCMYGCRADAQALCAEEMCKPPSHRGDPCSQQSDCAGDLTDGGQAGAPDICSPAGICAAPPDTEADAGT